MTYDQIVSFHGHNCPGLAIGYRMSQAALNFLSQARAEDEELVAIVENDACGIDAVQCLTGCTFGKGNLIFRDYGKQVYTVFSRGEGIGVRVVFDNGKVPTGVGDDRQALIDWLLSAAEEDIVSLKEVRIHEPERAQIRTSVRCAICGEGVMETRASEIEGKLVCIPCSDQVAGQPADSC